MPLSKVVAAPRPLSQRKLDVVWLVFFVVHIIAMLAVDLVALYPTNIIPSALLDLRAWYVAQYQDQYFVSPPRFFLVFLWMEALFHLPVSVWAIRAILRDDSKLPIVLLIFAVQTAVTTTTCLVDTQGWDVSEETKMGLVSLYAPYLAVAFVMGTDMYTRLSSSLTRALKEEHAEKALKRA